MRQALSGAQPTRNRVVAEHHDPAPFVAAFEERARELAIRTARSETEDRWAVTSVAANMLRDEGTCFGEVGLRLDELSDVAWDVLSANGCRISVAQASDSDGTLSGMRTLDRCFVVAFAVMIAVSVLALAGLWGSVGVGMVVYGLDPAPGGGTDWAYLAFGSFCVLAAVVLSVGVGVFAFRKVTGMSRRSQPVDG